MKGYQGQEITPANAAALAQWREASGSPYGWRVVRAVPHRDGRHSQLEEYSRTDGVPRYYKTAEKARKVAAKLNAGGVS